MEERGAMEFSRHSLRVCTCNACAWHFLEMWSGVEVIVPLGLRFVSTICSHMSLASAYFPEILFPPWRDRDTPMNVEAMNTRSDEKVLIPSHHHVHLRQTQCPWRTWCLSLPVPDGWWAVLGVHNDSAASSWSSLIAEIHPMISLPRYLISTWWHTLQIYKQRFIISVLCKATHKQSKRNQQGNFFFARESKLG